MWAILTNPDEYVLAESTNFDRIKYTIFMGDVFTLVETLELSNKAAEIVNHQQSV